MQSTTGAAATATASSRTSGGGPGLARFRSAPAAWLEALLEDDEEDPLKPNPCLTQLLAANSSDLVSAPGDHPLFDPNPSPAFHRQNSSPPEFLAPSGIAEGFYTSYPLNSSPTLDISPTSKPATDVDAQNFFPKFSPQLVIILFATFCFTIPTRDLFSLQIIYVKILGRKEKEVEFPV